MLSNYEVCLDIIALSCMGSSSSTDFLALTASRESKHLNAFVFDSREKYSLN